MGRKHPHGFAVLVVIVVVVVVVVDDQFGIDQDFTLGFLPCWSWCLLLLVANGIVVMAVGH